MRGVPGISVVATRTLTRPATIPVVVDTFARPDGPLGYGWIDGHDAYPRMFEPLGISAGNVVVTDPTARGDTYADPQDVVTPPAGQLYHGIGCAYRDFGSVAVRARLTWSGLWTPGANHHIEATPLLHVRPGTARHGFGVWPSILFGVPALLAGSIGAPPEQFAALFQGTTAFTHVDGTPRVLELVSDGAHARVYLDGIEQSADWTCPYPLAIPAELTGATMHGFAVDAHLITADAIPATPAMADVRIEALDDGAARPRTVYGTTSGKSTHDPAYAGYQHWKNAADPYPSATIADLFGTAAIGLGSGAAVGDAFLLREGPNAFKIGYTGNGDLRTGRLRLGSLAANPAGPNEVGDLAVVAGVVKVCTVAGTPGTWTTVGAQ